MTRMLPSVIFSRRKFYTPPLFSLENKQISKSLKRVIKTAAKRPDNISGRIYVQKQCSSTAGMRIIPVKTLYFLYPQFAMNYTPQNGIIFSFSA